MAAPALPWGRSDDGAAQHSDDTSDDFGSSIRKLMLSAALGGLVDGRPAKRARTDASESGDTVTRANDAVEAFRALTQADEAVPADLTAGQHIQVRRRGSVQQILAAAAT